MNLYATTTGDRASKGQGDNKKLDIVLTSDNKEIRYSDEYHIIYQKTKTGTHLIVKDLQNEQIILATTKDKKQ